LLPEKKERGASYWPVELLLRVEFPWVKLPWDSSQSSGLIWSPVVTMAVI
jgi:hypothetical protein